MNLKKDNGKYELWNNSELLATNYNNTLPTIDFSPLSEEDCKKIRYVDVKKLGENSWVQVRNKNSTLRDNVVFVTGYIEGFKAAQSLVLSQTVWNVEVEMEDFVEEETGCELKWMNKKPKITNNSIKVLCIK